MFVPEEIKREYAIVCPQNAMRRQIEKRYTIDEAKVMLEGSWGDGGEFQRETASQAGAFALHRGEKSIRVGEEIVMDISEQMMMSRILRQLQPTMT